MSKLSTFIFKFLDIIVIFTMTFGSPLSALAAPSPTGAAIASDLADYPPGATVTLNGAGWVAGETVHIFVNDDAYQTWSRSIDVVASNDGSLIDVFQLPNWFVANYSVIATGPLSGTATTSFTDLNIGTYDQCSNDDGDGYASGDAGCRWINGNLQRNNSVYMEGDATVQRLWLTDLTPGSTHNVTLKYGTTKGGKHAYDFLTTWNWSEDWVTLNDLCQALSGTGTIAGCTTASQTTFAIPNDPNLTDTIEPAPGPDRLFTMAGGTITAASTPEIVSGDYTGDSETVLTITYTVGPGTGSMCTTDNKGTTTCGVMLWFGAHVSVSGQWKLYNGTTGAGTISGSPYHVALDKVDGAAVGQRDNQMQAEVVTYIPNGTIVMIKDAVPNDAQDFSFNLNNNSTIDFGTFYMDDDAEPALPNSLTFDVPPGTWYAKELLPLPAGWTLTNLACVDPTSNTTVNLSTGTAIINLASLETVTCTYTDTKAGHIIVKKVTEGGDYSFEFDPSWGSNFFLSNGQTSDSGPLSAGTYSVAELNVPSTWQNTKAECDDGSPVDAIALAEGETVTCTFTNTRVYNQDLTVTKTAEESFGRTYTWDIYKNVDKTTANIPDGSSATFNYTVGVTHDSGTDSGFVVSGVITVHNPNAFAVTGVDVTDAAPGGTCTVTNGTNLTAPAGGDATANYSCTFATNPGYGTNTATASWDANSFNTPTGTASGTANFDFAGVTPSVLNATVTVTDSLGGDLGTATYTDPSPKQFTYSYTFNGIGGKCTKYDNTATINENGKFAKKIVEVCVGKDLTITKTATASKDRLYKWLIDKNVDKTQINIAEGGTATFNYDVIVTPDGFIDSGYVLGGTITINNPNDWEAVTVGVTDTLDKGGTCTITEAAPYVVPKSDSLTLHYTCESDGTSTKNTAKVTWNKDTYSTPTGSASNFADVTFTVSGETHKTITVIDDKTDPANPVTLGTWNWADGAQTFQYALDKQGVAGTCTDYTNKAVIDETDQSDSQTVTVCVGKDLTVTKTAAGTFNRTYKWLINKSVDDTRIEIANGDTATFNYTVKVTPAGYTDSAWAMGGTITVTNPNDWEAITADVTDSFPGGTCTITGGEDVVVQAGQSVTRSYSCTFASQPNYTGTNTATAIWDKALYFTPTGTASGTAEVTLGLKTETNRTITVVDDKTTGTPVTLGTADYYAGPFSFTYSLDKPGVAGTCTDYTNTAVIDETDQSASQTVTVCVGKDLLVSKTAEGSRDRTYKWMIDKSVDDTLIEIAEGGTATFNYAVQVLPDGYVDSGWTLGGTITIANPNDWEEITVDVTDVLDKGGTCSITEAAPYIVPKSGSLTLHYTCATDGTTTKNTATVTWDKATYFTPNASASAESGVSFGIATENNKTITVIDDKTDPANPVTLGTVNWGKPHGPFTYTIEKQGVAGTCTDYTNTAVIDETDQSASQTVTVCVGKDLLVSKTAEGSRDRTYKWMIDKSVDDTLIEIAEGGTATFNYAVQVLPDGYVDSGWTLGGTITIANPNDWEEITVDVTDVLDKGGTCSITEAAPYIVPKSGSLTLHYTCATDGTTTKNTATVTWDKATYFTPNASASAESGVSFGIATENNKTITVIDDKTDPANPVTLGTVNWGKPHGPFTYTIEKQGVAGTCTDYTNTAVIDETKQSDSQTITVCVGKDLTVTKKAGGTFNREYFWNITKDADQALVKIAESGSYTFTYTVVAEQTGFSDSGWTLTGVIHITNPNDWEPITLTSLSDLVDNGGACVLHEGPYIVDKSATIEVPYYCTYTTPPTSYSGTNTATATWDAAKYFTPSGSASGEKAFELSQAGATAQTIHVTDSYAGDLGEVTATDAEPFVKGTFTYSRTESGVAGKCTKYDNTATITETAQSADETVTLCVGKDLTVSKTASPSFTRTWDWTILKTADASYNLFAGQSVTHGYKVTVTPTSTDSAWQVVGTITIINPNDWEAIVANVSDAVDSGGNCAVTDSQVTIPANDDVDVGYTCTWESMPISYTGTNTATVTWDAAIYATPSGMSSGSMGFEFKNPTEINPVITVDDDNLTGEAWSATRAYAEWTYTKDFSCSSNPADYAGDGKYDYSLTNTATINETTGDNDTATVTVNCYAPLVSKTAAGTYEERHEWDVEKTVTPVSQSAFAGDTVSYEWTVVVTEQTFEEHFKVAGEITVVNPAPIEMTVDLADALGGGTVGVIGTCTNGTYADGKLTIPANTTAICGYTAKPEGRTDTANNVTATLNGIAFDASKDFTWTANVIRGSAILDDDQNPAFPLTITDASTWKYTEQYTCSTDKSAYDATTHKYTFGESNIAIVTSGGAEEDRDDASVSIDCYVPAISKDANGKYDQVHDWEVFKTVNTASQTAFAGEKKNFTWTVRVDETTHGENYMVTGKITVVNPNPEDALTIALNDKLDDGSVAVIGPCTGGTWSSPNLTVPVGGTATCDYTVTPKGDIAKFAAALPATVTINSANPGPDSYWLTTVTNDGALNGVYEAWCVDIDRQMTPGTNYTAAVYSSYEAYPSGLIEKAYDMDLVNWIINQDFVGKSAAPLAGTYTYGDVQRAIWEIIEDNPTYTTAGLGTWNQARVDQLEALARANGQNFVPTCGDFVAVLLVPTGGQQPIAIAQVTFASLGLDCAESNSVKATLNGVDFLADAEILWTVNKINETASLDDDQKLDWPTTVSADTTFQYTDPQGYTCSTDPEAYTNGYYQYTENNTAVLTYSTGSDTATASTAVKCYAPVVSKTAAGVYDERHEWDVTKTVTPLSQDVLAGSTGNFTWTVNVTESVTEEKFGVAGTVSIKNPRTDASMVVSLSDVLNDGATATITGCTVGTWNGTNKTVSIPANSTAICSYTAAPAGRTATLNTATVKLNALTTTATANVGWTPNVIRGSATLDDTYNPAWTTPITITDSGTFTYSTSEACSTTQSVYNTTTGTYTFTKSNTATVTTADYSRNGTAESTVTCYAPVVTKDVTTYFNRDWDWTITKDYDATYNLFAGGSVTHGYKVTVDPTYTDNFWGVKGTITVANSHPTQAMVLTSVSDLAGGINAPVTCDTLTVPAAGSITCSYDTGSQTAPNANPFGNLNTATAVFAAANWTGSAPIAFSATPTTENDPVIKVIDDNLRREEDPRWFADRAYAEWNYTKTFYCSADPAKYTGGTYSYSHTNTAWINETGQDDTATVDVNCYAPKVIKDASTYWNRNWDWTIVKDYDASYNLFAGDTVTHGYKVMVDPTYTDNFWGVKGSITVYNYHPTEAMTLTSLTDLAGGIDGNVTCESLVVPAAGSLTCTYDTGKQDSPDDNPFGNLNTASAAFAGANWTGTYPIVFSANPSTENEPVITVDDDNLTGETWSANRDSGEWTYTKPFACSTNPADYTAGKYSYSLTNTAKINETGQTDTAKVDVTCYWPQIKLTKTGDALSKIGDGVTYTIKLDNNTPTDAGLRALSCTITDAKIGFSKAITLASGASGTSTKAFTIPAGASDPFLNTASVTCKPVAATAPVVGSTTFSVDDSSLWSTNLFQPNVEIIKTGPAYATSGDVITYTFTINNLSSSDSPNLMLDTLTDDVLGDLANNAPAVCDELAAGASCTFTVNYTVPDVGLQSKTIKNIVTVHYHPAGFPNDITDTDDHTVLVTPKSQLTDTSFCPLPNNQFRLLYHLELAPNIYRLQASNPGQWYMNAFYYGAPGSDFTMTIQVPYPFVTQEGAGVPIQVHDGTSLTSSGCYIPTPSLSGYTITTPAMIPTSSAGNQIITAEDYTTKNLGSYTTVTVTGKVPATGLAYVTIHLDYALKRTGSWKMPGTYTLNPVTNTSVADVLNQTGFGSGPVTIHGYEVYNFARTVGSDTSTTTPSSFNEFKKFAGFMGFVTSKSTGNAVTNAKVVIYNPYGKVLATVYTDADGYYMYAYKHTAKSATYTVKLPVWAKSVAITVKANGLAAIDFETP
jgi:hypothetical protein